MTTERAFGQGCDSRIRGESRDANPYGFRNNPGMRDWWRDGWDDCDRNFGVAARWPVKRLPSVEETR